MGKYTLSQTLTIIDKHNRVYNWLNGGYVEFEDLKHPFLKIVKDNTHNFDKFSYKNSYDDFEWLLNKKFIVENREEIQNIIFEKTLENNSG